MKFSSLFSKINIRITTPFTSKRQFYRRGKAENDGERHGSIKEGYMWKMKDGTLKPIHCGRWKKRYLILSEDQLCFLKKKGEMLCPQKIVKIFDVVSLMIEDFAGFRRKTFGIRLRAGKRDSYLLKCRTEDERNDWITAVLTAKSASLVSQGNVTYELL